MPCNHDAHARYWHRRGYASSRPTPSSAGFIFLHVYYAMPAGTGITQYGGSATCLRAHYATPGTGLASSPLSAYALATQSPVPAYTPKSKDKKQHSWYKLY
eukprot:599784-Rhodomonas_salina.1